MSIKSVSAITLAIGSLALSGCASLTAKPYNENHSRAYNIAREGDLLDVKDYKIPQKTHEGLSSALDASANTVLLTSTSGFGMGLSSGLGLGIAATLLGPKSDAARNSFIAWMPKSYAISTDDAQRKMIDISQASVEKTLNDRKINFDLVYSDDHQIIYNFYNKKWKCPEYKSGKTSIDDLCKIKISIFEPIEYGSPTYINKGGQPSYAFFSGHSVKYSYLNIEAGQNSSIPQSSLYKSLSLNLPKWSFLYIAPGNLKTDNGETVTYPTLLEAGKFEFFVYPS